mmetsp:Transcript_16798/g.63936  ORF Transcript_16798/g.63936 Transcript_16798/m.63936 type:complete len:203 (-) Transcript_16798:2396-3004(-)
MPSLASKMAMACLDFQVTPILRPVACSIKIKARVLDRPALVPATYGGLAVLRRIACVRGSGHASAAFSMIVLICTGSDALVPSTPNSVLIHWGSSPPPCGAPDGVAAFPSSSAFFACLGGLGGFAFSSASSAGVSGLLLFLRSRADDRTRVAACAEAVVGVGDGGVGAAVAESFMLEMAARALSSTEPVELIAATEASGAVR